MDSLSRKSIVLVRNDFNEAIADKNVSFIRSLLAPNYHIVTGRSAQNHGVDEECARWADLFRDDPSAVYVRTTGEILVNEEWGLAHEAGIWQGSYSSNGESIRASGVYSAKWQRAVSGDWKLQVEVFTTLECAGPESGCLKPDPI